MKQHLRIAVAGSGPVAERWASAFGPCASVSLAPEEAGAADALVVAPGGQDDAFATARKALAGGTPVLYATAFRTSPWQAGLIDSLRRRTSTILRFAEPFQHEAGFRFLHRLTHGSDAFWQLRYLRTTSLAADAHADETAIADLSICQALIDMAPQSVTATSAQRDELGGMCAIFLTVRYPRDIVAQCTISQAEAPPARRLTAVTRTRTVSIDRLNAPSCVEVMAAEPGGDPAALRRALVMPAGDPVIEEARRFAQAVEERDGSVCNSERWARVAALWWAARQSMSFGGAVQVPDVVLSPANRQPPPLHLIEGGGQLTRTTKRPQLTLIAG